MESKDQKATVSAGNKTLNTISSGMGLRAKGVVMSVEELRLPNVTLYQHHVACVGNKAFIAVSVPQEELYSVQEGDTVDYQLSMSQSKGNTYFNKI